MKTILLVLFSSFLFLAGCGQKGSLYLPQSEADLAAAEQGAEDAVESEEEYGEEEETEESSE